MHVALRSVLVLLECTVVLTARRWNKPSGRIYGGHEAVPYGHPYMVSLQQRFFFIRIHICGGSLITVKWAATAAHCVVGSRLIEWLFPLDTVVAGTHDIVLFGPHAQVSDIDKKIVHRSYKRDVLHNDIAMVRTATPFTLTPQVQPIRLPVDYEITVRPLVLAGWGALRTTSFIPDMPRKLHEAIVKYMPYDECSEAIKKVQEEVGLNTTTFEQEMLNETVHICTAPERRGVSGCPGDSGGPLVQFTGTAAAGKHTAGADGSQVDNTFRTVDSEHYPVLVGIASWIVSPPCGRSGMPTIYTRVSNYIDFIKKCIDTKSSGF